MNLLNIMAGVVFNVRMYSYIFILWEMCDCLVLQGVPLIFVYVVLLLARCILSIRYRESYFMMILCNGVDMDIW